MPVTYKQVLRIYRITLIIKIVNQVVMKYESWKMERIL
jgi:hypothetical protein